MPNRPWTALAVGSFGECSEPPYSNECKWKVDRENECQDQREAELSEIPSVL